MFMRFVTVAAVISSLCLVWNTGLSQIPNAGFETWSGGNPTGWATSNAPPVLTNVTQSSVAHSGASAVRGDAVQFFTTVMAPVIQVGPAARGFAYNQRPASFTGYYQFHSVGGDRFGINVGLFSGGVGGTAIAFAASANPTEVSSYTQFNVPFVYQNPGFPDTCIVQIQIVGPTVGTDVHVGSYFLLDDIALVGTNAVGEEPGTLPSTASLEQNFPNPFNPTTDIRFRTADHGFVTLKVYDLLGREVMMLVNSVVKPGAHTVRWDATGQPSGVYYCRLLAGNFSETRKLILTK